MGRYTRTQWLTLIAVCTTEFGSSMCISLQAPFYPQEAEKKGVPASEYGLVFGIFELVAFFVSPLFGKYIQRIGSKRLLNLGTFTTGTCAILFGLLDRVNGHYPFIILSFIIRIIEALGSSAYFTASSSTMAKEFPNSVSTTFATLKIFFGLGLIVGPTVGGLLYEIGGYTLPFVVLGCTLFSASTMAYFVLPEHEDTDNKTSSDGKFRRMLNIPGVRMSAACICATSISVGFLQAILEPHLRQFNLSPVGVGSMFIIGGGTYAVSAPIWGWICDKKQYSKVAAVVGSVLIMAGFSLIGPAPFVPSDTLLWMVVCGLVIHGLGVGAELVSGFTNALKSSVTNGLSNDIDTYGLVSGLWISAFALGAFIGPSVAGLLFDTVGMRYGCLFVIVLNFAMAISSIVFLTVCDTPVESYSELGGREEVHVSSSAGLGLEVGNAAALAAQGMLIERPTDLMSSLVSSVGARTKLKPAGPLAKPTYGSVNKDLNDFV